MSPVSMLETSTALSSQEVTVTTCPAPPAEWIVSIGEIVANGARSGPCVGVGVGGGVGVGVGVEPMMLTLNVALAAAVRLPEVSATARSLRSTVHCPLLPAS